MTTSETPARNALTREFCAMRAVVLLGAARSIASDAELGWTATAAQLTAEAAVWAQLAAALQPERQAAPSGEAFTYVAPRLTDPESWTKLGYPDDEAAILAMPQPKGNACPACKHPTGSHRMHGCDFGGDRCECPAPHGRILPGDHEPQV